MKSISPRLFLFSILSAVLHLLPFPIAGPVPAWRRYIAWFCLVPFFYALTRNNKQDQPLSLFQSALIGYLCGVVWFMGNCYWIYQTMHIYGQIPELVSFGILILFALYLGLYYALFGYLFALLRRKLSLRMVLGLSPFLWVAVELARDRITGFPWDLLGYTQVDNSLITKLAPIGGVMLISFLVAAINAFFVIALCDEKAKVSWVALASVFLAASLLQAGRLVAPPQDAATNIAVLLQENLAVGAEGRDLKPFPIQEKYRNFTALSLSPINSINKNTSAPVLAPAASPSLIIWPEAPADFFTSDPTFRYELGTLARTANAPVIVGSAGIDVDPTAPNGYHEFGSAAIFAPDGSYIGRYDKIHRVPWGEYVPYKQLFAFAGRLTAGVGDMEAGTEQKVFNLSGHSTGIFICYESIFGDEVRHFVLNGAQVLVNISDDGWYGDSGAPWQHLDMARMRAIENDRWILRDTNTGITTAIDPHGRGDFLTPRHVRSAFAFAYGYRTGTTFYTRHGDWFAWLSALITLFAILVTLLPYRQLTPLRSRTS